MAPIPDWVARAPDSLLTSHGTPVEAGESDFPLLDEQVRLSKTTAQYSRYAQRLTSQANVDAAAQISIVIDPVHEYVRLHEIRVFRDQEVIDKLPEARRSLLNREERLNDGLIDGRVTLHLLLQDIRVGDVLDYSYTTERRDALGERGYNQWFGTRWAAPVRYQRLRVLRETHRALYIRDEGGLAPPKETVRNGWKETLWEGRDIAALRDESGRPGWDFRYPHIELSEFADWNSVREWALPFYPQDKVDDAAFAALLEQLRKQPDEAGRIVAALRFVQDEIRYTGLEIGAGAWRPNAPAVVLARRYGDCKDKVRLLVALLRGLGVNSWPALVSARTGRGLLQRQPSPGAFDHVVAKVRSSGRDYWLEATASSQGGKLDSLVQADWGPALVLQAGADGLAEIPRRRGEAPTTEVREMYDFGAATAQPAKLKVHTLYRDEDADAMRARMLTATVSKLGEDYQDYYRKRYAGLRPAEPLKLRDDRDGNVFVIDESYEIDQPFKQDADGKRTFDLEAYLVSELTNPPAETLRTSPLARKFPRHVAHEIVAYLPGAWNIAPDQTDIDDPAFQYRFKERFADGKLELSYDFRSLSDHVPVSDLRQFLENLKRAHGDAFYTLTDDPAPGSTAAALAAANRGPAGPSIEMITTLILALGIGVLLVLAIRRLPLHLPAAEPHAPHGLGGWMVPPVIGVTLAPFIALRATWLFFDQLGMANVFQRLELTVRCLMLGELLLLGMLLVLSVYCIWSLYSFSPKFPVTFVLIHVISLLALGVDTLALAVMGDAVKAELSTNEVSLMTRLFVSAIWVSYVLMSQRVRATFAVQPARDGDYRGNRELRPLELPDKPAMGPGAS